MTTPVADVHSRHPALALVPAGSALVAATDPAAAASVPWAARLATDPDRTTVVVAAPGLGAEQAADGLARSLAGQARPLRLVWPGAGPAGASRLAAALGVEVVVPDAPTVALPDGGLFVYGGDRTGSWRGIRPDGTGSTVDGPRYPAPPWQAHLPAGTPTGTPDPTGLAAGTAGLVVEHLPCGLWLRAPRVGDGLRRLAYAIPADTALLTLVVGAPDGPPLPADAVRRLVAALPTALHPDVLITLYGDISPKGAPLGRIVAADLGHPVEYRTGIPVRAGNGWQVTTISPDGRHRWSPFATRLRCPPHAAEPDRITGRADGFGADGILRLDRRWVAEVVPAGLWVRPRNDLAGAELIRSRPTHQRWCTLFGPATELPRRAAAALRAALPPELLPRLRWAVAAGATAPAPRSDHPVHHLHPDGTITPPTGRPPADPSAAAAKPESPRPAKPTKTATAPAPPASVPPAPSPLAPAPPAPAPPAPAPLTPAPPAPAPPAPAPTGEPAPAVIGPPVAVPAARPSSAGAPSAPAGGSRRPVRSPSGSVPGEPRPVLGPRPPAPPVRRRQPRIDPGDLLRPGTPAERDRARALLGRQYDAHARTVTTLLAERPGLRVDDPGLMVELAAACAYLAGDHRPLAAALRCGEPPVDPALAVCAAAGLRRLPAYPGPVWCGAAELGYRVGETLVEPGFLAATLDPRVRLGTAVEVVVWSTTGRRLRGLAAPDRDHEVLFGPGTRFHVLAIGAARDGTPDRVYLCDTAAHHERLLGRLRAAADHRDRIDDADRVDLPDPTRLAAPRVPTRGEKRD